MVCIFCKKDSSNSKSVEHIIPESLGNKKNFLQKGIVCDKCNNYLSAKIEKPLMEMSFFRQLRARNSIESKRNRIPFETLWFQHKKHAYSETEIEFYRPRKGLPILSLPKPMAHLMIKSKPKDFLITSLQFDNPPKNDRLVARFLGKVALEALANVVLENKAEMNLLIDDERLDPLRNFTRYNAFSGNWEYYSRRLYGENEQFYYADDMNNPVDVLYQYQHFFIGEEMFMIVIIKGYEFAINVGNSQIRSYINYLLLNEGKSPLHSGKIIFSDRQSSHR